MLYKTPSSQRVSNQWSSRVQVHPLIWTCTFVHSFHHGGDAHPPLGEKKIVSTINVQIYCHTSCLRNSDANSWRLGFFDLGLSSCVDLSTWPEIVVDVEVTAELTYYPTWFLVTTTSVLSAYSGSHPLSACWRCFVYSAKKTTNGHLTQRPELYLFTLT